MKQQQSQSTAFEINAAIKKRAEKLQAERGYDSSHMVKARAAVLANLKNNQKETLISLAKANDLIPLRTFLHVHTDLSIEAIDSFMSLANDRASQSDFENFCAVWNIK